MTGFFCMIPLISSLFAACIGAPTLATGYVEGEYRLIAPVENARVAMVSVAKGNRVGKGALLAQLDNSDTKAAVAQAKAALANAKARLENLQTGKRPQEIASLQASLRSARAQSEEAERNLERQADLIRRGVATQSTYDSASTSARVARLKAEEVEAQLELSRLPAREAERKAAEAAVDEARANLETAHWRLAERQLHAPEPGEIADVLRREGEMAGPSSPVISLLPDGAVKLVFFVEQALLSQVSQGTSVEATCDGCPSGQSAVVEWIASEPEFTPPVIYSLDNRQKLVWRVEAAPTSQSSALKPGQIVDVHLPASGAEQ